MKKEIQSFCQRNNIKYEKEVYDFSCVKEQSLILDEFLKFKIKKIIIKNLNVEYLCIDKKLKGINFSESNFTELVILQNSGLSFNHIKVKNLKVNETITNEILRNISSEKIEILLDPKIKYGALPKIENLLNTKKLFDLCFIHL